MFNGGSSNSSTIGWCAKCYGFTLNELKSIVLFSCLCVLISSGYRGISPKCNLFIGVAPFAECISII